MERRRSRLSRRGFVAGAAALGLVTGCGRLPWQAPAPMPHPANIPHVGYLVGAATPDAPGVAAFRHGLAELGYTEGHNIVIEYRFADGRVDRLPEMAAELVQIPVDVIVTAGTPPTRAARSATTTIPIVQTSDGDLVAAGLVASLARPGGNVTGQISFYEQLTGKRLEFLQAVVPGLSRVTILWSNESDELREAEGAAQALGLALQNLHVRDAADLESAFTAAVSERVEALLVLAGSMLFANASRVAGLAAEHRIPGMYFIRDFVNAGGLMSYAPSHPALHRRAAYYVDRILKGTKPADLPVEQPMVFDFVVNLKTARELGIIFPNEIMLQVTEVIQ